MTIHALNFKTFQILVDKEEDDIPGPHPGEGRDKAFVKRGEALGGNGVEPAMLGRAVILWYMVNRVQNYVYV